MAPFDPLNVRGHYKLVDRVPVEVPDLMEWAMCMEGPGRQIRLTRVGPHTVSTIFLGLDHNWGMTGPPVLFETMSWIDREHEVPAVGNFPGATLDRDFDDYQTRCCTWDQAIAMHEAAIAHFREPGDEVEELKTHAQQVDEALASIIAATAAATPPADKP